MESCEWGKLGQLAGEGGAGEGGEGRGGEGTGTEGTVRRCGDFVLLLLSGYGLSHLRFSTVTSPLETLHT